MILIGPHPILTVPTNRLVSMHLSLTTLPPSHLSDLRLHHNTSQSLNLAASRIHERADLLGQSGDGILTERCKIPSAWTHTCLCLSFLLRVPTYAVQANSTRRISRDGGATSQA